MLIFSYQVIVVSGRGHVKSEIGSELPTYERKAGDVLAIINSITKDSVTVLGFSDGAYTGFYVFTDGINFLQPHD